ncbi:Nuclear transcription factor Y subunit B-3 [Dionaea muscipula]
MANQGTKPPPRRPTTYRKTTADNLPQPVVACSIDPAAVRSMADSDNDSGGKSYGNAGNSGLLSPREQDRFLPIANVSRIMKRALPANAKISKDAKETVQECVSEFISFITGEASDKCLREKRKTINGDDLLWAMTTLGFEDYVEPLKVYLQRFRELEGEKTTGNASVVNSGGGDGVYGNSGVPMMGHHQQVAGAYGGGVGGRGLYNQVADGGSNGISSRNQGGRSR